MARTEQVKKGDIKKMVQDSVRESVMELNLKQGDDDFETQTFNHTMPQGSVQDPVADDVAFDVFSDVGEDRFKKGLITRYAVKKNGQHLATLEHPLSWDKVREKFGSGHYQVVAKDGLTGAYLKWQTQMLGELPQSMTDDVEPQHTPTPTQESTPSFFQIMQMMESKAESARREAREEARMQQMAAAEQTKAIFGTFAELFKAKNNEGQNQPNMQIEMMKMMQSMTEKLADNQREMFKEINKKIEDVSKKGKDDLSLSDILKLSQDQQAKGFDMYSKFYNLAEKIADDKVESMEEARSSGSGGGESDSITTTLIKSLAPLLAAAAAQQAGQPMVQAQPIPQLPARRAPTPQHRGVVRRGGADGTTISPTTRPAVSQLSVRGRGPTNRPAPKNATAQKAEARTNSNVVSNDGENRGTIPVGTETESGLPTLSFSEVEQKSVETILIDPAVKAKATELLPAFLGQLMLEAVEPVEAARKTIQHLSDNGIGRELFLANVGLEDVIAVANQYTAQGVDLPQEAFMWLNDLYANIQNPT